MLYYIIFNNELTPQEAIATFLIVLISFVISLSLHELAHGLIAFKMGDDTPKLAGRLTLNPFAHLSGMGMVMFLMLGVGWAKPMPVNPIKFKKYRVGIRLTSIAGVATNFALGLIAAIVHVILLNSVGAPSTAMEYVYEFLNYFMLINSMLALFNLMPIFPLDGFNFITSFMKSDNKFVQNGIKNGSRILIGILLGCLLFDLFFGIDILDMYLSLMYRYIFWPIATLGV